MGGFGVGDIVRVKAPGSAFDGLEGPIMDIDRNGSLPYGVAMPNLVYPTRGFRMGPRNNMVRFGAWELEAV